MNPLVAIGVGILVGREVSEDKTAGALVGGLVALAWSLAPPDVRRQARDAFLGHKRPDVIDADAKVS